MRVLIAQRLHATAILRPQKSTERSLHALHQKSAAWRSMQKLARMEIQPSSMCRFGRNRSIIQLAHPPNKHHIILRPTLLLFHEPDLGPNPWPSFHYSQRISSASNAFFSVTQSIRVRWVRWPDIGVSMKVVQSQRSVWDRNGRPNPGRQRGGFLMDMFNLSVCVNCVVKRCQLSISWHVS